MTAQSNATALDSAAPLYRERLRSREDRIRMERRRDRRVGNLRLAVFVAGLFLAWLVFAQGAAPAATLALPVAAFFFLALHHERVVRDLDRATRAARFYDHGLARIEGRWHDRGARGERFTDPAHPYSGDLDIFGDRSLFQLLCTARTGIGEETLAGWLAHAAPPENVAARQSAVEELRPLIDAREELALLGEEIAPRLHPEALIEWAESPPRTLVGGTRRIAAALVALSATILILLQLDWIGPPFALLALAAQAAFGLRHRNLVHEITREVELPNKELALLAELLADIEKGSFRAPLLAELRESMVAGGKTPAAAIRRLRRTIELLDARRNQFFAPLAPLFLWGTQLSLAVEAWRVEHGSAVARWIEAVGTYEATHALAGFSFERPDACYPSIESGPARFSGRALRHPLMPLDRSVPNDISLDGTLSLLVVSGSNMSGKSTLMRTIGTNAVLAQMGAPVCAEQLSLSPLRIGTSMRTQDSLLDGTSRFYAEIHRLKQIVSLTDGEVPTLFLLDEILSGTNSHDRRIGAEAVVRTLLEHGAIGMISTHDLTLATIAKNLAPLAQNVHFADELVDGAMTFDYRLHAGVVEKSNALELMRSIGLRV